MVRIQEKVGDIFKAPPGSVLVHACNCEGSWGAGVANVFKQKYPAAYQVYHAFCTTPDTIHHKKWLVGTALLIPPQPDDYAISSRRHWIACLFTSLSTGVRKDKPDQILIHTRKALVDLKKKLQEASKQTGEDMTSKVHTVRMNAGLFKVPWQMTKRTLELGGIRMTVMINLDAMRQTERTEVLQYMKENKLDEEGVARWEAGDGYASEAESPVVDNADREVAPAPHDEIEEENGDTGGDGSANVKQNYDNSTAISGLYSNSDEPRPPSDSHGKKRKIVADNSKGNTSAPVANPKKQEQRQKKLRTSFKQAKA